MDYQAHHDRIIANAKQRGLDKSKLEYYTEKHHIIPQCLGGSDLPENLVLLSAKEHFVIHHLLWKMHGGKLAWAFFQFQTYKNMQKEQYGEYKRLKKLTASEYANIREDFAQYMSKLNKGKILSDERRKQISESMKGLYYWTNGTNDIRAYECPGEGYTRGRTNVSNMKGKHAGKKYFTNGKKILRGFECPEGYWEGRPVIEEGRKRQYEKQKGKPSPAKGMTWKHSKEFAEAQKLRKWYTNGTDNRFTTESPGEEWRRGMIKTNTEET